jgi:hypothetical protein
MSELGTANLKDRTAPPVTVHSPFHRSATFAGGFVRSNKMELPDYEAAIAAEDKAWARLKKLADLMARDCMVLWQVGDGHGGSIAEHVLDAFHKRGAPPMVRGTASRVRIPTKVKKFVFERDAYRCVKCQSYKDLCVDHIYPYSLGGTNEPDNLQILCWPCNSKKGTKIEVAA